MKKSERDAWDSGMWAYFHHWKATAFSRSLDFKLTFSEFSQLVSQRCFFCKKPGTRPITNQKKASHITQLNRLEAFTPGNTAPICYECAKVKRYVNQSQLLRTARLCKKLHRKLYG